MMMRSIAAVFCFALLLSSVSAAKITKFPTTKLTPAPRKSTVGLDLCPFCIQFTSQSINELLNIILNAGVIGGCAELCSLLPQKLEAEACNIICDILGIEAFIKLIEKADLDPIYFCELAKLCPVHDCDGQCVKITDAAVAPQSGPQGTTFKIGVAFQVYNQTSVGTIAFSVLPPDGMPFGDAELVPKGFVPGTYQAGAEVSTEPNEQEPFEPGVYKVDIALCEGECGSKHPHSAVYDTTQVSFQITQ